MDILGIEQLKKSLLEAGANERDLDKIIKDVNEIILAKVLSLYESRLNEEQKNTLKSIPAENLVKYIEEHKDAMPTLSKEELESVVKEIWKDYFATMKKA